jgi:hypothetical protein
MRAFADKLVEITERHAEEIAEQWCRAVRTSNRTPSYHVIAEDRCVQQAVNFYKNLGTVCLSFSPSMRKTDITKVSPAQRLFTLFS